MDKKLKETKPPEWADRFFAWYCNPDLQEEIQGDLYEAFLEKVKRGGLRSARRWYWWNVVLFINGRTLSRSKHVYSQQITADMFRNYCKVGYRNIVKNKMTTLINALGMALAIGCCLVVFEFFDWWFNMDDFHLKRDEIYVVQRQIEHNGEETLWNDTPEPLGIALQTDFPQVGATVRVRRETSIVQQGDQVFDERVARVDAAYFDLFDFPFKWGNSASFQDPEAIIISASIAEKYFGEKNPVGEELRLRFRNKMEETVAGYVVRGVLEEAPPHASFFNHILLPLPDPEGTANAGMDWTTMADITFLQIKDPGAIASIKAAEEKYLQMINAANEGWKLVGLHFQPLKTVARTAYKVRNNPFNTAHVIGIVMLGFIAIALLLLACFNYVNITLASAATRLKEIGIRKVMGSNQKQLIIQFLTENFLICLLALLLGILLASTIFIPWFNRLVDLNFQLSYLGNWRIWCFTIALVIFTAIGGAAYPAVYLAKFRPIGVLKREFRLNKKGGFRKWLISIQLSLTIITIFSTFVFFLTTQEMKQQAWGYEQHHLAVIQLENSQDFAAFRENIRANPNILTVAGSQEQIGKASRQMKVQVAGQDHEAHGLRVSNNYIQTLGLQLVAGRDFAEQLKTDGQQAVVVNETFRRSMHWDQAIGKIVKIGERNHQVIGVVADFHYQDFMQNIEPLILQLGDEADFSYVSIRTLPDKTEATIKMLAANWKQYYPNTPYAYSFQDDVFAGYFNGFGQLNRLLSAAAFMTILIALIGLFGLAMLLLNRSMKELSIRKVLGANLLQNISFINRTFFFPVLVALMVGLSISFFLMSTMLQQIAPLSSVGILPFILTTLSVLLILGLALAKQIHITAISNPVKYLREE